MLHRSFGKGLSVEFLSTNNYRKDHLEFKAFFSNSRWNFSRPRVPPRGGASRPAVFTSDCGVFPEATVPDKE